MSRTGAILMVAIAVLSVAGALAAEKVKIAVHDWPPFLFAGSDPGQTGLARDLIDLCIPETGYVAEFEFYPLKRMFSYLEEGRIDINVMSHSEERARYAVYSRVPLFTSTYRPFVRSDSNAEIRSFDDFEGHLMGHLAGLRASKDYLSYLERRAGHDVVTTTTQDSLIDLLTAGRVDIFVLPQESLSWRLRERELADEIRPVDFEIRTASYFVTISKASPRVLDASEFARSMDSCLLELKSDGRYERILSRYGVNFPAPAEE